MMLKVDLLRQQMVIYDWRTMDVSKLPPPSSGTISVTYAEGHAIAIFKNNHGSTFMSYDPASTKVMEEIGRFAQQ